MTSLLSNLEKQLLERRIADGNFSSSEIFSCPEESFFYAQCLERMLFNQCLRNELVVEFGSGDGIPVINSLLKSGFSGVVHGFELSSFACDVACSRIKKLGIDNQYIIHNQSFFEGIQALAANYLIANPPYIPAPDAQIMMPDLYGGRDGAEITKQLLSVGCQTALLMVSAYSNPIGTINHALAEGYKVVDFMVAPLQFGRYSSEPKVQHWIHELRQEQKAFYSESSYFLAGVLFNKSSSAIDLSDELIKVMTVL
jgi:hypothetical protein